LKKFAAISLFIFSLNLCHAAYILIPMDEFEDNPPFSAELSKYTPEANFPRIFAACY